MVGRRAVGVESAQKEKPNHLVPVFSKGQVPCEVILVGKGTTHSTEIKNENLSPFQKNVSSFSDANKGKTS